MTYIKRTLWALLALLGLGLAGLALYAWRALPVLDGELKAPGLRSSVQVLRDAADVTHIHAGSAQDAWFALGYVHAQERTWQLAFNRRVMHGTLSEVLGPATLDVDKLMRTLDIMGTARRQYQRLPPAAQEALQRYSAGIQAFHTQRPQALPPEFHLLRTEPGEQAWTPEDCVGWALMMALDLGGNWGHEFTRLSLLQVLDTPRLWELMPPYPGEARLSALDLAGWYRAMGIYASPTEATAQVQRPLLQDAWGLWAQHWVDSVGTVDGKGSNNWTLAGERTTSGRPLLANDPHLGLNAPAIWYFASLQAPAGMQADGATHPALKVMGATLPGLPFVVLGRTDQVAWGFTNTGPDVQDLYIERIHPNDPNLYQTPTGWERWQTRPQTIKVKGQADVTYTARSSRHGPVISDAVPSHAKVLDLQRHVLALRWSALEDDNQTVLAGLLGNEARDVDSLFAAFAHHHSPMQNVVAADVHGHIGYKAIGRTPLRSTDNDLRGVAPAPGWLAKYDWQGWRAFEDNPQDSGQRGWIATANQRVEPPGALRPLTADWSLPYRYQRIADQLQARERHDVRSMQALQNDLHSNAMLKLWPHLLNTQAQHPLAGAAMAELKRFDGTMAADQAAPLIGAVWVDELVRGIIAPRIGAARFDAVYGKRDFRAGLEGMLQSDNRWWCGAAGCQVAATQALERTLTRIAATQGNDVSAWRWGQAHMARSKHQPFGQVDALARIFNVTRATGGDTYTVNAGQYNPGDAKTPFVNHQAPSMRAIYDLADLEQSVFIYQTGQSGLVHSSRYRDMADEWATGRYRPLQFQPAQWTHRLTLQP